MISNHIHNYAVQVTQGSCTDTSDCILISPLGIDPLQTGNLAIYPNPVINEMIIENKTNTEKVFFEILNSTGQVILNGDMIGKRVVQTSDFAPGIYPVKITGRGLFEVRKIVKD